MCLVVHLRTADGLARAAVVRDASDGGAFLLTGGSTVHPGDTVELEVVPFEDGGEPACVRGRVVRARPWEAGELWRLALAVRFEGHLPESVALEDIAARQAHWAR
jgi:hypothetical protein